MGKTLLFLFSFSSHFAWKCTYSAEISFSCCRRFPSFLANASDEVNSARTLTLMLKLTMFMMLTIMTLAERRGSGREAGLRHLVGRLSFHLAGTRVLNRIIMSLMARTSLNCKVFFSSFSFARCLWHRLFTRVFFFLSIFFLLFLLRISSPL